MMVLKPLRTYFGRFVRFGVGCLLIVLGLPLLCLIEPFRQIRLIEFREDRIGHLAQDTELFVRKLTFEARASNPKYVFLAARPANRQLLQMWKRRIFVLESVWLRRAFSGAKPILARTRFIEQLPHWTDDSNSILGRGDPCLSFTPEEEQRGREFLEQVGLGPGDWFVCFHCRDASYLSRRIGFGAGEVPSPSYQDADIATYFDAIKWVRDQGGFVFRMGAIVDSPLPPLGPRIIDYASSHRTDFLDIYLSAHCRFFIGSNSGIVCVPQIFNVPLCCANIFPFGVIVAGAKTIFIPKLLRSRSDGSICSLTKLSEYNLLQDYGRMKELRQPATYEAFGLEIIDNDAQDILQMAKEMYFMTEKGTQYPEADELQRQYRSFFSGSEATEYSGRVSSAFLQRHRELLGIEPSRGKYGA